MAKKINESLSADNIFKITEKQQKAVELLACGQYTKKQIADELGIAPKTLWQWGKGEEFQAALKEAELEHKRRTLAFINSKAYDAAVELWKICQQSTDHRTKEKALAAWLDRALGKPAQQTNVTVDDKTKTTEDFDIEKALSELKEQLDNGQDSNISAFRAS